MSSSELSRQLKSYEGSSGDLQRRLDELTLELSSANGDNQKHLAELVRLNTLNSELADKNNQLARENKHLTGGGGDDDGGGDGDDDDDR